MAVFQNYVSIDYFGMDKYDFANESRGDGWLSRKLAGIDIDVDERYELISKSLKVSIPVPEKYEGCDNDLNNFLSSYYPDQTQEEENKTNSILESPIQGGDLLSRNSFESMGSESYGFISTPNSLDISLSVEALGLESYGFIGTDETLMNTLSVESLGLEKYGFVTEDDILSS